MTDLGMVGEDLGDGGWWVTVLRMLDDHPSWSWGWGTAVLGMEVDHLGNDR